MDNFWQDLRYSARVLLKNRRYTVVAVLTLALGIGVNTTIFSFSMPYLFPPLPFTHPDRVVMIWTASPARGWNKTLASLPDLADWKLQTRTLEDLAAYFPTSYGMSGGDEPVRVSVHRVTANYFTVLGVKPALGRTFLEEEDRPGANRVALLSHGFWQRRFGGDPAIVNKTVKLGGHPHTVIGVLPREFWFPTLTDTWTPLAANPSEAPRDRRFLSVVGRLKPGVTAAQARAEMTTIASRLAREYPDTNAGLEVRTLSVSEEILNENTAVLLALLSVTVGFVLLIACINVANITLARAQVRQRETAIRAALGASRGRLVRQHLTESLLLGVTGGACGLLLAYWGMTLLVTQNVEKWPLLEGFGVDASAAAFTAVVSLLAVVAFGLVPALGGSKPNLTEALKEGGSPSSRGFRRGRFASALVVSEVALALPLLLLAGLSIRAMIALQGVDWGFDLDRILTMRISLPADRYVNERQVTAFYQQLLDRVAKVGDVQAAAAASHLPSPGGRGSLTSSLTIEGHAAERQDRPWAVLLTITPDYLRAMGMRLLKGRQFSSRDAGGTPAVALVNSTAARRYWPNTDPLGQRISLTTTQASNQWMMIVGIVGDAKDSRTAPPAPYVYLPHSQQPRREMALMIRTASDPLSVTAGVRETVRQLDGELPVEEVRTLEQYMIQRLGPTGLYVLLLNVFGVVALLLAVIGIYGVLSYSVSRRTHEIGVRMALGARPQNVLGLVIRQGMFLASVGMAIGLVAGIGLSRVLAGVFYGVGVKATDPVTFLGVGLLLSAFAWVACYLPARRATGVDPVKALRDE